MHPILSTNTLRSAQPGENEWRVLQCCMFDVVFVQRVIDVGITEQMFADGNARSVYRLIVSMHNAGRAIDTDAISHELNDTSFAAIGGIDNFIRLTNAPASTIHGEEYIKRLFEAHRRRDLVKIAARAQAGVEMDEIESMLRNWGECRGAIGDSTLESFMELRPPDDERREETNLLGDGFLRRGQGGIYSGPTGIGKSVLGAQAAMFWACGRMLFGIRPQNCLRILLVQSENDEADLAEMREGITTGCSFAPSELDLMRENIKTHRSFKSGKAWLTEIAPKVAAFKPDIIIADPLFAYAGVDIAKDQPGLTAFLREQVQPFIIKHNCGIIFAHHTNKPPTTAKDKQGWQAGDFAYAGSGHNELANWPRFTMVLRSLGSRTVFELRIGKRWSRAGIADERGRPTDRVLIKHSDSGICWHPATEADLTATVESTSKAGRGDEHPASELLELLTDGMTNAEWKHASGWADGTFRRKRDELLNGNAVSNRSGCYYRESE